MLNCLVEARFTDNGNINGIEEKCCYISECIGHVLCEGVTAYDYNLFTFNCYIWNPVEGSWNMDDCEVCIFHPFLSKKITCFRGKE